MSQITKIEEWKVLIQKWKDSGLNKTRWCRENGYKVHQMYYWIEQIDKFSIQQTENNAKPKFLSVEVAEEHDTSKGSLLIHINQLSIEVRQETDIPLLSKVLQVVQS